PNILFRSEALNLAKSELNRTVERRLKNDTTYVGLNGNLLIERKVEIEELLTVVKVSVKHKPTEKIILELEQP
ncbi:MAG: hypothetical protein OQJ74_03005, partial [Ignavibacteriaceae bacterium]|nr:hypothetical protein [Ignavibacteriaceae bacterium]